MKPNVMVFSVPVELNSTVRILMSQIEKLLFIINYHNIQLPGDCKIWVYPNKRKRITKYGCRKNVFPHI